MKVHIIQTCYQAVEKRGICYQIKFEKTQTGSSINKTQANADFDSHSSLSLSLSKKSFLCFFFYFRKKITYVK